VYTVVPVASVLVFRKLMLIETMHLATCWQYAVLFCAIAKASSSIATMMQAETIEQLFFGCRVPDPTEHHG
jgi:hypothetical protein